MNSSSTFQTRRRPCAQVHPARAGFSLVEILIVIAVIGILAALSIPMLSNSHENASAATAKRNAQTLSLLAQGATAAGSTLDMETSLEDVIDQLLDGVTGRGAQSDLVFQMSPLTTEARSEATLYLALVNGSLIYTGAP